MEVLQKIEEHSHNIFIHLCFNRCLCLPKGRNTKIETKLSLLHGRLVSFLVFNSSTQLLMSKEICSIWRRKACTGLFSQMEHFLPDMSNIIEHR